jgi:hypothetical protein
MLGTTNQCFTSGCNELQANVLLSLRLDHFQPDRTHARIQEFDYPVRRILKWLEDDTRPGRQQGIGIDTVSPGDGDRAAEAVIAERLD